MLDLHTHILPDIDDGPATLDEALAMARAAVADGITLMAATPHSSDSSAGQRYSVALVRERLTTLRAALAEAGIPLQVLGGTEVSYAGDLPTRLDAGTLLPYEGCRAMLLEPPYGELPAALPEVIFGLQTAGYRVVLAHPERLKDVQRQPERLRPLVERGVLVQLTADALTGRQGSLLRRTAETLLTTGLVHILASDAHNVGTRPPLLAAGRAAAAALLGESAATALVSDIPRALLADAPIPDLPTPPRRRWWPW